jgi:hypothetical protein
MQRGLPYGVLTVAMMCALSSGCASRGEDGAPCKSDSFLGPAYCDDGLICNQANICQKPMTVGDGGPCNSSELCKAGLWCDLGPRSCRPFLREGDPCTIPDSCGPGVMCTKDASAMTITCRPGQR